MPACPSHRPEAGAILEYRQAKPGSQTPADQASFLELQDSYCFFYKPAGLHTAHIKGSPAASLEAALPAILPPGLALESVRLLQRLDARTSGLIAAALTMEAEENYRRLEKAGKIRKFYLALLEGKLEKPVYINLALDTANRRRTRVLATKSDKGTQFQPLRFFTSKPRAKEFFPDSDITMEQSTLALCRINAGQRHQIRVHAAAIGHPLCGDAEYGRGNGNYALQHFGLFFPGHEALFTGRESFYYRLSPPLRDRARKLLARERPQGQLP